MRGLFGVSPEARSVGGSVTLTEMSDMIAAEGGGAGLPQVRRLPAVATSASLYIADKASAMPLRYKADPERPLPDWMTRPDPRPGGYQMSEMVHTIIMALGTVGWTVLDIYRDTRGQPVAVWPLRPYDVTLNDSRRVLEIWRGDGGDNTDMMVVRYATRPGRLIGYSPVGFAASIHRASVYAEDQMSADFAHASVIPGVISTKGELTPDAAKVIRAQFRKHQSGPRNTRLPVVLGDSTWHDIAQTNMDAQFRDLVGYTEARVAALYHLDPSLLGIDNGGQGRNLTYQNIGQRDLAALRDGVVPFLDRVEAALSVLAGGAVEFDWHALLRPDQAGRMAILEAVSRISKNMGAPLFTVDEMRAGEGLPPLTDDQIAAFKPGGTSFNVSEEGTVE